MSSSRRGKTYLAGASARTVLDKRENGAPAPKNPRPYDRDTDFDPLADPSAFTARLADARTCYCKTFAGMVCRQFQGISWMTLQEERESLESHESLPRLCFSPPPCSLCVASLCPTGPRSAIPSPRRRSSFSTKTIASSRFRGSSWRFRWVTFARARFQSGTTTGSSN